MGFRYICKHRPWRIRAFAMRLHTSVLLLLLSGTAMVLQGCAGTRPRYGAAPHKKRGCDCPKWNALPPTDRGLRHADRANYPHHHALLTDAARY